MGGIDDLNFEELVDGALDGALDDVATERFDAQQLFQPKARKGLKTPVLSGKEMASDVMKGHNVAAKAEMADADVTAKLKGPPPHKENKVIKEHPSKQLGAAGFEHIYMRSGVEPVEFDVFRLQELFDDPELADLTDKGRVHAVRAILKSHNVEIDDIVADALRRQGALETHDSRLRGNIERVEREMEQENERLQTEIEEYANPRIARMEKNNDRVERLRRDYRDWYERKQTEHSRIVEILEPWGGDERLRTTDKVPALARTKTEPPGDETVESINLSAVSTSEVFDTVEEQAIEGAGEESAEHWSFAEEASEVEEAKPKPKPKPKAKIETELPSTLQTRESAGVTATGEFDFVRPPMRWPHTPLQWLATIFALAIWPLAGLLLTAQLSMVEAPGAFGLAFGVPIVLAWIVAMATRRGKKWWLGFVSMFLLFSILTFAAAHADPANLVKRLTKRPLWFIDEAGMSASIEEQVYEVTSQYATAIAEPLGVADAIVPATPPTKK